MARSSSGRACRRASVLRAQARPTWLPRRCRSVPPWRSVESQQKSGKFRPIHGKIGGLLVERGLIKAEALSLALQEQERGDRRRLGEILVALNLAKQEDVNIVVQVLESKTRESAAADTIRVGVNLLDKLMTLVGELVLARNQLLQPGSFALSDHLSSESVKRETLGRRLATQPPKA